MENTFTKATDRKIKVLAIYQILGGLAGFGITFWLLAHTAIITGLILLLFLIAFALFSYSIYCGALLLKKQRVGLVHSSINQYLQLVSFAILGFGFQYVSGVLLSVGIDLTTSFDMKFNIGIMSTWEMNINSDTEKIEINFNLVALFVIIFIDKLRRQTASDGDNMRPAEIAE